MVDGAADRELFEVYTADQARLILGIRDSRSVSEAARRRETNGGAPVYWDHKDPGNPTAVQLFDAAWVRDRALDHDGVHADLMALLVPLSRRVGMTLTACRVRVERNAGGPEGDGELVKRLGESELVLDSYRREAETERNARQESELAAKDVEIARLREDLTRRGQALAQLAKVVEALNHAAV